MTNPADAANRNSDTALAEPSPWHSSAVKTTLRQQHIQKLLAYAGDLGILESKGAQVNDLITEYISKPQTPDYNGALKAIHELRPAKEAAKVAQAAFNLADWIQPGIEYDHRALLKIYRAACAAFVGTQLRETLQGLHKAGFVTMPTVKIIGEEMDFLAGIIALKSNSNKVFPGCLMLHDVPQEQDDLLLHGLKKDAGANEVAVVPTPPLPSGGKSEPVLSDTEWCAELPMTSNIPKQELRQPPDRDWWSCELTDCKSPYWSCLGHFSREIKDIKGVEAQGKTIAERSLGMDLQSSIDQIGITPTVNKLYMLLKLEENLATKTKPTEEPEVKNNPFKLTQEDWFEWLKPWQQKGYTMSDALRALNEYSVRKDYGPVTKFSEWPSGLSEASDVMTAYHEKIAENLPPPDNAQKSAENESAAHEAPETPATANEPQETEKPRSEPTNITPIINIRTITGINILNIQGDLNKPLPPEAYQSIDYGVMKGKTDLDGNYVRERFDQVFGPMGVGWRIVPNGTAGRVEYKTEQRSDKTWHVVSLIAHTFQYSVIMPDGSLSWTDASTTSDLHDNVDQQYAYRGAMTSIMKQFFSLMGGMNHIRHNEYTHVHAQRDLARRKSA